MNEQLYAIPVNDAFSADCECPVCAMYRQLEKASVEYTIGPSYMEDDVRMETNRLGFCEKHVKQLYSQQNRLGLALMLHTHMQEVIAETEGKQKKGRSSGGGLFKKSTEESPVTAYLRKVNKSCFICSRVANTFDRYIDTIFYLYRKEDAFREKFGKSKGFCMEHYRTLYDAAPKYLSGKELDEFTKRLDKLFLENMQRVCDDIEWYIDKFDYRNTDAPWKSSKDAVPRTVTKLTGAEVEL